MKKIVIIYGLIAGAIVGTMLIITMPLYESGTLNFDNGELLGYTTMVVALSMVFFGVKSYRDNYSGGTITFGQGAKVGLLITLIASLIYAMSWEVSYNIMNGDFIEQMGSHYETKMKANGATATELAEAKEQMDRFIVMYKNPFIRFGITIMEIAWVGVVISLISAALLSKKNFLRVTN